MEKRIFIGARQEFIVGIETNVETCDTMEPLYLTYEDSAQEKRRAQREGVLRVLINMMNEIEVAELSKPVTIYVCDTISKDIIRQTYKFWAFTGTYSTGELLDENELAYWNEFAEIMATKGHAFVFKDMYDANFKGKKTRFNKSDVEYNQFYYDFVLGELNRLAPIEKKEESKRPSLMVGSRAI